MVLGLFQMVFFSKMTLSSVKESDGIGSEVYHSLTHTFFHESFWLSHKKEPVHKSHLFSTRVMNKLYESTHIFD